MAALHGVSITNLDIADTPGASVCLELASYHLSVQRLSAATTYMNVTDGKDTNIP